MLLAAIHWTGVPLPAASHAIAAVSMWATMVFGYLIFQRLGRPLAAWPFAAILATAPLGLFVGMETLLCVALVMAALYLFLLRRDVPLGIIVVIVTAARAEGALLAGVLVLLAWRDDRKFPSQLVWAACGAFGMWAAVHWGLVGQILPTTLDGRIAQVMSGFWRSHVEGLVFYAATGLSGSAPYLKLPSAGWESSGALAGPLPWYCCRSGSGRPLRTSSLEWRSTVGMRR